MYILKNNIQKFRTEKGMKQSELAELVDVRRETILKLEAGKYNPSLKLAMSIAKVFEKTVEEVFSLELVEDQP